jgi:hypothetical protein
MKFITIAIAIILAASASAQWTVVNLHPAGATSSGVGGVHGGQQAGAAIVVGVIRASLWSGTAGSWMDLHPAGATFSLALDVNGGQQVGYADVGGFNRASLWSGTAASWVDLTPAGSNRSDAQGVDGGQQVGTAVVGGTGHAGMWSGTAASWVDLNPPVWIECLRHRRRSAGGQGMGTRGRQMARQPVDRHGGLVGGPEPRRGDLLGCQQST